MRQIVLFIGLALGVTLAPLAASADIPPPDSCRVDGDACATAPPDFKSPGVCTKSRCAHDTPDGTTYYSDCNRCDPRPKAKTESKPKK
jgi:hypothetical protein